MEGEYLNLYNQGLIQECDVVKVLGINSGRCERCLNTSNDWLGRFNYKGEAITYCRQCLDFKMVDNKHYLYRSIIPPKITENAHILDIDFKLSPLQQRASNFAKQILNTKDTGLIWAVCMASE
ncbi:MAG: hypothetical protein UIL36_08435 [Turicibacter sp.]|nr:hypothetical protein [Turicibacter sp.]